MTHSSTQVIFIFDPIVKSEINIVHLLNIFD